ncbi:ankyrin repeat domain-containing protein [Microbulbifer sp. SAOS-129_SWC]|uniref:ankyrin repeat domain-containing protein n=1 Tax=Microbulbifer sp. SAOS-129_SWC TaxID=3145235 RepID=UPI003217DC3F
MDLSEAFRVGNEDFIISHLEKDYDVDADPEELLLKSAHYGRERTINKCLKSGISPDTHNALNWACGKGRLGPIKILVKAGANVNLKDSHNRTPMMCSAGNGKLNEVKFLLKNGARCDGALLAAVDGDHIKVVEFLISEEVDLEEISDIGLTALTAACASSIKKSTAIALLLIDAGANVNFVRESDEQTPLKFASGRSSLEVMQSLIDRGVEIDGPQGTDQTALMLAARSNSVERVDLLIKSGANPNLECGLKWANGATAKGLAEMENCQDVVKYFSQLEQI